MNRMVHTFVATAAVSFSIALAAQGPSPNNKAPKKSKSGEQSVTLQGCLRGGRFEPDHSAIIDLPAQLLAQIFDSSGIGLVGKRELLVQIRSQHERHHDVIAGVLLIPPKVAGEREVDVKTAEIGKRTRIIAGTRTDNGGQRNENGEILAAPVQIRVESITHRDGPAC
jgi:hypothetical protein